MKRFIFLIASAFVLLLANAQTSEVKHYINKYDVKKQIEGLPLKNAMLFWQTIFKNNARSQKFLKALNRKDKALEKAYNEIEFGLQVLDNYDDIVPPNYSLRTKISRDLGIETETKQYPIKIINDPTINASMDPRGQMRINSGAIRNLKYEELLAVCAHEVAHNYCVHVYDRAWKAEKKRRRNEAWAGVGYGLMAGALAVSGGINAAYGQNTSGFDDFIANSDIIWEAFENEAHKATIRFRYRYSREEEIEADIIGYRFLEYMGYGKENMLSLFKKLLELYGDTSTGKYDDHPSTKFRIEVISAMMSGYSGK